MPWIRNTVSFERQDILLRISQNCADAGSRGTAHTHVDEVSRNMGGVYAVFLDKAQHDFEIGSGSDFRSKRAKLLIAAAMAIKSGVGRHPTSLESAGYIPPALPTPYKLLFRIDKE